MVHARLVPVVLAGVGAGIALGVAVTAVAGKEYRATAVIEVAPAADPRAPGTDAPPLRAEVLAESWAELVSSRGFLAQVRPRVAAGELDVDELDERVEARRPDGTALLEIAAKGSSARAAERLAADVAQSLLTLVRQLDRQRAGRVVAELQRRVDELTGELARGPAAPERLSALREERRAVLARLVSVRAGSALESAELVAAPQGSAARIRSRVALNVAGGALLGLVTTLGVALLGLRRREEPRAEVVAEPEPEPEREAAAPSQAVEEPQPVELRVAVAVPHAGETLAGTVPVAVELSRDADAIQFLVSDGGPEWRPIAAARSSPAAEWDTTGVADGHYWVSAVARNGERAAAADPVPVRVSNSLG